MRGVLFLDQATIEVVRSFLRDWTVPYPHPHESSPGITVITVIEPTGVDDENGKGFTSQSLPLHTDRAHASVQPTIVGCLYTALACKGGESLLLDGARVIGKAREKKLLTNLDKRCPACPRTSMASRHQGLAQLRALAHQVQKRCARKAPTLRRSGRSPC